MKFKFKALAVAVALAAIAGQASAAITAGNDPVASPNGDVVFYAVGTDASGNVFSYARDLGVSFNTFVSTPSYAAIDLTTDANWTSFTGTAATGSEYWGLFATQKTSASPTAAGALSVLTTAANNDVSLIPTLSNAKLTSAFSNANNWIAAANLGGFTNPSAFYAAAPLSTGIPVANLGAYLNSNLGSSTFINATNVIGTTTTASFFDAVRGAGSNAVGKATVSDVNIAGAWNFDGTNLSYSVAAVPEPETYGMLAAGLLMLGAVARRRRA
jgi:hypothetical protein